MFAVVAFGIVGLLLDIFIAKAVWNWWKRNYRSTASR